MDQPKTFKQFIELRKLQSEHKATMIRRYIATPNKFIGKKQFTERDALDAERDAAECGSILNLLKELAKAGSGAKEVTVKIYKPKKSTVIDELNL